MSKLAGLTFRLIVVEAAGLLLGIENTNEGYDAETSVYKTVLPGSIYGPTLQAIALPPTSQVLDRLRLLDLSSISDEVAHQVFAKTLQASFAAAGNARDSPGLAPPWAGSTSTAFANSNGQNHFPEDLEGHFRGGLPVTTTTTTAITAATATNEMFPMADAAATPPTGTTRNGDGKSRKGSTGTTTTAEGTSTGEVGGAVQALKLAVVGVTRRLMDDVNLLPLRNRTTAVLVDGSRMSLLALELAGAAWKFGRFVVIHVCGEKHPGEARGDCNNINNDDANGGGRSSGGGPECDDGPTSPPGTENGQEAGGRRAGQGKADKGRNRNGLDSDGAGGMGRRRQRYGRWDPDFLEAELRETCLQQLEIPEESLELVFRSLPPESSGTVDEITKAIDATLVQRGVDVVYMGCYGRGGPRVSQFGRVGHWALEHTPYQIVFAKKFSPSMVAPAFFARPKRYLVAVTSDLDKVSYTLERLLPLISPRDSLVLIHIVDECVEDVLAGDMVDVEQVESDLSSLLADKRGLSYRVRVETTGRPPEHPTQTVVQRIVMVAEEEAADFLAILYDESRGSYRTVATGCLRETRCGLIAIH